MRAATLTQVRAGRGGRMIEISRDVMDLASRLREIDTSLGLDWNEAGEYYRVYQLLKDGRKHTVTTSQELTPELIERVRMVMRPDYDYSRELERRDAQARSEADHRLSEQVGEIGERLAHAIRKDTQVKSRVILPAGVSDAA